MAAEEPRPPYRREAFTNGLNLAFLTVVGIAGLYDHNLWVLALPIEAAFLWIVPDLPPFRMAVDKRHEAAALEEERAWYLDQLWGLRPLPPKSLGERLKGLFFEQAPKEAIDERVVDRGSEDFSAYLEMRSIVARLRELVGVRGVHFNEVELRRCEKVINGYLRLLIACQPLERAVEGTDIRGVRRDLAEVERSLESAEGPLRTALMERRVLLTQQVERAPRLEATLHLFRARADAIVQQLRNIHGQVLADPGMNVNEMLDQVIVRQEALADPLQEASADRIVDEFLRRPDVKAKLQGGAEPARLPRPPPQRQKT